MNVSSYSPQGKYMEIFTMIESRENMRLIIPRWTAGDKGLYVNA